jgi:antitoxin component of MazEF toxin-antitoxin module
MATIDTPRTLSLREIGNSLGVILPREILADLGVKPEAGATLVVHRCTTTGRLELSAEDAEFTRKLDALRKVMAHFHDTFRELAK